jgi:hypothetical protein
MLLALLDDGAPDAIREVLDCYDESARKIQQLEVARLDDDTEYVRAKKNLKAELRLANQQVSQLELELSNIKHVMDEPTRAATELRDTLHKLVMAFHGWKRWSRHGAFRDAEADTAADNLVGAFIYALSRHTFAKVADVTAADMTPDTLMLLKLGVLEVALADETLDALEGAVANAAPDAGGVYPPWVQRATTLLDRLRPETGTAHAAAARNCMLGASVTHRNLYEVLFSTAVAARGVGMTQTQIVQVVLEGIRDHASDLAFEKDP